MSGSTPEYARTDRRRWEGGFASALDWLLAAAPAPVSRRADAADYPTVLAEATEADAVLYRAGGPSTLAAAIASSDPAPITAIHFGGAARPVPAAVAPRADGSLPVDAADPPAATVAEVYDAMRRHPRSVGMSRTELWAAAAAEAEVNCMAVAYADGVPAVPRHTVRRCPRD